MAIDRSASANFHGCVLWLDAARVAWRTKSRSLSESCRSGGAIGRLISATASLYEGRSPLEQTSNIGRATPAATQRARNRRLEGVLGVRSASPMPFFLMPLCRALAASRRSMCQLSAATACGKEHRRNERERSTDEPDVQEHAKAQHAK